MIVAPNFNIINVITNQYKTEGDGVRVRAFTLLDIYFTSSPYCVKKKNGSFVIDDDKTDEFLYGYVININNKQFFINSDGRFHLEDTNGFMIDNLTVLNNSDIHLLYNIKLEIMNRVVPETQEVTPKDDIIFDFEDNLVFDFIEQNARVLTTTSTNLIPSKEGYELKIIDIETDTETLFEIKDTESSIARNIVIGETEHLVIEDIPYSLKYVSHLNSKKEVVTTPHDILITYYYQEV